MAEDLISDGLAVSYYFSFIEKIFKNIHLFPLNASHVLDKDSLRLNATLDVVLPKTLEAEEIEKCINHVLAFERITLPVENGRSVNIFTKTLNNESIEVTDFPTSFDALYKFLNLTSDSLDGSIDLQTKSKLLKGKEREELDKFKSILEFLIENFELTKGKVKVYYLE